MASGRLVWISDDERALLTGPSGLSDELAAVLDRWDAAPEDPAFTAIAALRNERLIPVRTYDGRAVHVVLRALGLPA